MTSTEVAPDPAFPRAYDAVFFFTMAATAVALGGALAHVFELANKIDLPRDEYFTVQNIYRGWNLLAIPLTIEMAGLVAVIVMTRHDRRVFRLAILALASLITSQVIFWVYTYPANAATENWTVIPDNWRELRSQWEYSHAAGAVFQMIAMGSLIAAALARKRH